MDVLPQTPPKTSIAWTNRIIDWNTSREITKIWFNIAAAEEWITENDVSKVKKPQSKSRPRSEL